VSRARRSACAHWTGTARRPGVAPSRIEVGLLRRSADAVARDRAASNLGRRSMSLHMPSSVWRACCFSGTRARAPSSSHSLPTTLQSPPNPLTQLPCHERGYSPRRLCRSGATTTVEIWNSGRAMIGNTRSLRTINEPTSSRSEARCLSTQSRHCRTFQLGDHHRVMLVIGADKWRLSIPSGLGTVLERSNGPLPARGRAVVFLAMEAAGIEPVARRKQTLSRSRCYWLTP